MRFQLLRSPQSRRGNTGTKPEVPQRNTKADELRILEEVTFRLRSEVRAGHEMKSRKSTSGRQKGNPKGLGVEEQEKDQKSGGADKY